MRIASGVTDQYIYFVAVDITDLKTRETGLSGFTVYRSRNGGAAAAYTTPTINETDVTNMPGVYELLLDEDMTIDSGDETQEVCLHITHASMAPVTRVFELYRPKITAGETLTADSSGRVDVGSWLGNAAAATTVAGVPEVDVTHWLGLGVAGVSGTPQVNAIEIESADATDVIADAVWNEDIGTHTTLGTFGQVLNALGARTGEVNDVSASSTSFVVDGFTEATDDHFNGMAMVFTSGALLGQKNIITDYTGSTQTMTFGEAWTEAPANNDDFVILPTGVLGGGDLAKVLRLFVTILDQTTGQVDSGSFAAGAIDAAAIAANAITSSELADGAITAAKFAAGAIDATAIGTGAIDADAIAADAITAAKIANDAIGATEIANGAIDAATFAAGAIDAAAIATDAIDADALASDAVDEIADGLHPVLVATTIATLASQTSFTLTAGSTDDSAYVGCIAVVEDVSTATQKCVGVISAYTGSTKTVTLLNDPGVFTMAATDKIRIIADRSLKPATDNRTVGVESDGHAHADVKEWLGTAVTTSATSAKPEVDVNSISDDATAADNAELMFDGAGYAGGTEKLQVDAVEVNSNTNAAARLALSAAQIIPGTVDTATFTPTTTQWEADDITEATADHYNGRVVIWTSGILAGQASDITDYELANSKGKFTVTAMTEAPGNNDTFVIV